MINVHFRLPKTIYIIIYNALRPPSNIISPEFNPQNSIHGQNITQITRREIGFKSNNPNHLKDYRTSDHLSLVKIPILMIKNCDQPSDTELILLRDILTDLEEEGRDLVGQVTELDLLATENKGQSSGAVGNPTPSRLQQSISGTDIISLGAHNAKSINFAKICGKSALLNYCNVTGKETKFQFGVSMKRRIYSKTKTIG